MRISSINSLNLYQKRNEVSSPVTMPAYGLSMAKPLDKDTVSFSKPNLAQSISFGDLFVKTLKNRANGPSKQVSKQAFEIAEPIQKELLDSLRKLFKPLMMTPENPNGIIFDIVGRTKSIDSIGEKGATDGLNTKESILTYMTDLNGCKIILGDGSQKSVEKVLNLLLNAIKNGGIIPVEIDNKRPIAAKGLSLKEADKWDYPSSRYLSRFANKAAEYSGRELLENPDGMKKIDTADLLSSNYIHYLPYDHHKGNYMALHMLLKFPGQRRVFELQIMGVDLSTFKDLDDKIFKILNNKNVPSEYDDLKTLIKPMNADDEKERMEVFTSIKETIERLEKDNRAIARKIKKTSLDDAAKEALNVQKGINNSEIAINKRVLADNAKMIAELEEKIKISNNFAKYRGESFIFQREKEPNTVSGGFSEYFLPLKYNIPYKNIITPEFYEHLVVTYGITGNPYDMNNLYKIYKACKHKEKMHKQTK